MKQNASVYFLMKACVEDEYVAETQNVYRDRWGRGIDNNQLMPVIKHQWQIAHAKRPCQLSKWYLHRVCIIQRAAISAASWKMHVDLSRVGRMDIRVEAKCVEKGRKGGLLFVFYLGGFGRSISIIYESESTWGTTYPKHFASVEIFSSQTCLIGRFL